MLGVSDDRALIKSYLMFEGISPSSIHNRLDERKIGVASIIADGSHSASNGILLPMVSGFRVPLLLMTHFISDSLCLFPSSPLSLSSSQHLLSSYMSFSTNF